MKLLINIIRTSTESNLSNKLYKKNASEIEQEHPDFINHSLYQKNEVNYILSAAERGKPLVESVHEYIFDNDLSIDMFSIVVSDSDGLLLINVNKEELNSLEQFFDEANELFFNFVENHGNHLFILDNCVSEQQKKLNDKIEFTEINTEELLSLKVDELKPLSITDIDVKKLAIIGGVLFLAFSIFLFLPEKEEVKLQEEVSLTENKIETITESTVATVMNDYDELYADFHRGSAKSIYIQLEKIIRSVQQYPSWNIVSVKGEKEQVGIIVQPEFKMYRVEKFINLFSQMQNNSFVVGDRQITLNSQLIPTPALTEPVLAQQSALQNYIDSSFSDWFEKGDIAYEKNIVKNGFDITPFSINIKGMYLDDLDVITTLLNGFPVVYQKMDFKLTNNIWTGKIHFNLYSCGQQC